MAELEKQGSALAGVTLEGSDFASLLKKEFKPKTDEAKTAVETGRADAGPAGAGEHRRSSPTTRSAAIEAMIAAIDKKLTEQVNLILHHDDFQQLEGAWRGLHHLVNNTETDEMLKIRVLNVSKKDLRQDAQEIQGHRLGPEPDLQEAVRRRVRPVRRRAVRLPRRRLPLRPHPAGRRAARRDGQDRRCRPRAVHRRRRRRRVMQMESWQELANPRDLTKIFTHARVRGLALAARVGRRALHRPVHAALPGAPALRRQDQPGRRVRLRRGHRRRRPQQVRLGQRRLRDGDQHQPLVQACTAGARASAASSRAARSRACRPIRFPTDDGGVDMKCPTEIAISRPARSRAGEERLHAAGASQELRLRRLHRRPVAAEAAGVRRPGRHGQRQPGGAAAVSVRLLPLRALPEVHRARQDRLVQGARRHAGLAERVDHELRRRRPAELERGDQGAAAARRGRGRGRGDRGQSRLLQSKFFLRRTTSSKA